MNKEEAMRIIKHVAIAHNNSVYGEVHSQALAYWIGELDKVYGWLKETEQ